MKEGRRKMKEGIREKEGLQSTFAALLWTKMRPRWFAVPGGRCRVFVPWQLWAYEKEASIILLQILDPQQGEMLNP